MPHNIMEYYVLISCPSDAKKETTIVYEAIENVNKKLGDLLKIKLAPKHWTKDVFICHGQGKEVQKVINDQIVSDSDIIIGVFNNKLGSPTKEYESGTVEEISLMIKNKRQTFVFFSNQPIKPSEFNNKEYEKIKKFKNKYSKEALYAEFESLEELKIKVEDQLCLYLNYMLKNTNISGNLRVNDSVRSNQQQIINNKGHIGSQFNIQGNYIKKY